MPSRNCKFLLSEYFNPYQLLHDSALQATGISLPSHFKPLPRFSPPFLFHNPRRLQGVLVLHSLCRLVSLLLSRPINIPVYIHPCPADPESNKLRSCVLRVASPVEHTITIPVNFVDPPIGPIMGLVCLQSPSDGCRDYKTRARRRGSKNSQFGPLNSQSHADSSTRYGILRQQ